ncbi:MAG: alkaline phosphatase family protein [Clostridia bacterium]|nr:alkaline phosphatase family protein [Clostridia bacterium]
MLNTDSLDSVCAALAQTAGIEPPEYAAVPCRELTGFARESFAGKNADRVFMYNPDAIAGWISGKYPAFIEEVTSRAGLSLPLRSVMPSVTPVCFATMYTGAQPETHGIRSYTKPVLKTDTIFDALIRAGRRPAIVSTAGDSISMIFLEREMDYFIYETEEEVNAKACELIVADRHDFIVVYNGNFDTQMHRTGPESKEALAELRANARTFGMFDELIKANWGSHNSLVGFAMDHGAHAIDGGCGSHGLDMEEDLNITHFYCAHPERVSS